MFCTCLCFQQQATAYDRTEVMGDDLQILLPVVAYSETLYRHDQIGKNEFYESFFATALVTHGLKNTVHAQRPNGSQKSFPSGHTSAAFQGAAFIHARYGLAQAIPAYIAASFVGYSRIESHNHYPRDVAAGAALGIFNSFYFMTPEQGFYFEPVMDRLNDYGLRFTVMW